ncbi:9116_t:CDS:2 [Dentiscutata erythropus]|uniref:9116_t:CDS:1 n=1 Tax=Dentiscutata erythropus TaxID=1348616 RepID=A0A9N9N4E0_9GLOM|nr:9116_t:CDS:2 [Dentiscutata erythropus]
MSSGNSSNKEDNTVPSLHFDIKHKKQKISNTHMSSLKLSQSKEFVSDKCNNLINSDDDLTQPYQKNQIMH